MKIGYVVLKGLTGGGIEKYTQEIGERLVRKGHEIIIYSMRHYGTNDGIYHGMKIITLPCIKSKSLEKLTASFFATIKVLFDKNIDIVHFHAFGPSMFCILPRLLGKKTVVQGHGIEWQRSRWNVFGKFFLKLTEVPSVIFPNKLTVVSKVQQKYLKEKYNKESIYIPTGVNQPTVLKPNLIKKIYGFEGNDYILFAARLVREKGAHYLIQAYNMLKTDLKLVIAGDAYHEYEYKNELKKLAGENKNIIFTGFITGELLYEFYSNCYLFVLPSEIEGLPIALLESMSYGNCCLVSDIPENLEAINGLGYTFQNRNVDDLKDKINFLINNEKQVNEVKGKAQKYVLENFSWDKIADDFEKFYEEVLNG